MQGNLFDELEDTPQSNSLDKELKSIMIEEVSEKIISEQSYRDALIKKSNTYLETISFIESALAHFEVKELYEKCSSLFNFKQEILKNMC